MKPRLRFVSPSTIVRVLSTNAVTRLLSAHELERFHQLENERRRRDWLAGRLAAKVVARDAVRFRRGDGGGAAPAHSAVTVLNADDGAPHLVFDDRPELNGEFNISISHHDGFAVAALAHTASCGVVGVDLEWDRPLADRLVQRVMTADERNRLSAVCVRAPTNMALWCLKEAVLKASREASRISMRHVELSWDRRGQIAARILDRDGDDTRFSAVWRRRGAHVLAYAIHPSTSAN